MESLTELLAAPVLEVAPRLLRATFTHAGVSVRITEVEAYDGPDDPGSTVDWDALARSGTTLVILMGVATLPQVAAALVGRGMDPDTPSVVVENAGHPNARVLRSRLGEVAQAADRAGIGSPATVVIGAAAGIDLSSGDPTGW